MAVLGFTFGGGSGVAIIAAGGTDQYCHSEPPLTSGELCFIINFIGGQRGGGEFLLGRLSCPPLFLNRPLFQRMSIISIKLNVLHAYIIQRSANIWRRRSAAASQSFGEVRFVSREVSKYEKQPTLHHYTTYLTHDLQA